MPNINPYDEDTPEHRLWESAMAADLSALEHERQSVDHANRALEAHRRAELYRTALEKLERMAGKAT